MLHFFVVAQMFEFVNSHIVNLANINLCILFSAISFLFMVPIGYLSHRFIEMPFMNYRTRYVLEERTS